MQFLLFEMLNWIELSVCSMSLCLLEFLFSSNCCTYSFGIVLVLDKIIKKLDY